MSSEVIVGVLACLGTVLGTFGGIMASNKLTIYRIQKLEEKVDKHNSVIIRTGDLEKEMQFMNRRVVKLEEIKPS